MKTLIKNITLWLLVTVPALMRANSYSSGWTYNGTITWSGGSITLEKDPATTNGYRVTAANVGTRTGDGYVASGIALQVVGAASPNMFYFQNGDSLPRPTLTIADGSYTYKIWWLHSGTWQWVASGGGYVVYGEQGTIVFSGGQLVNPDTGQTKKTSKPMKFVNDTSFKQRITVRDAAGNIKAQFYVNPGETYVRSFERATGDTSQWTVGVEVMGATVNENGVLSYTGNNNDVVALTPQNMPPPSSTFWDSGGTQDLSNLTPAPTTPPVTVNSSSPPPAVPTSGNSTPSDSTQYRGTVVWTGTGSNATSTSALQTGDYKAGTEQVVGELMKANDTLKAIKENDDAARKKEDDATTSANTGATSMQGAAQSQYDLMVTAAGSAIGAAPVGAMSDTGDAASVFEIPLPSAFVGESPSTVSINPVVILATPVSITKALLALIITGFYVNWVFGYLNVLSGYALSAAKQAKGNTIGGTGGQGFALIAATIITVLAAALPVTLAAAADVGLLATFRSWDISAAFGSTVTGKASAYLFYQVVPVTTMLLAIAGVFTVKRIGFIAIHAFAAAVRWVVPVVALGLFAWPQDSRADYTVSNRSGQAVVLAGSGSLPDKTTATFADTPAVLTVDYADGSSTRVVLIDGAYLDLEGLRCLTSAPAVVWWRWFLKGFVAGMLCELFGLGYRLLFRFGSGQEAP